MKLQHLTLKNKKNLTLLGGAIVVNTGSQGHFDIDETDGKRLLATYPDSIVKEGDEGYKPFEIVTDKLDPNYVKVLEADIKVKDKEIADLKKSIEAKDTEIADLKKSIEAKDTEITKLKSKK